VAPADSQEILERFHASLDLVESIASQVRRAAGPGITQAELVSYGQEGLLEAARRYDPSRGVPFKAYAAYRVRGAVLDGVRALSRLPRRAHERLRAYEAATRVSEGISEDVLTSGSRGSAGDLERALDEHLAAMATAMAVGLVAARAVGDDGEVAALETGESPEEAVAHAELRSLLRSAIDDLEPQEAELVRRHYLQGERFDHVARELGLSKSWASRLHTRAVSRLARRFQGGPD
jgi:RNA polymerase sigma factor for flagellar operon FliA